MFRFTSYSKTNLIVSYILLPSLRHLWRQPNQIYLREHKTTYPDVNWKDTSKRDK